MNSTPDDISTKTDHIGSLTDLHNLPPLDHFNFIGREAEQRKLLEFISPDYRQHITVVHGVGGIGKTALVLKVANLCQNPSQQPKYLSDFRIPKFVAIIFISIKKSYSNNQIKQVYKNSALQYIFKTIAATLKLKYSTNTNKINKTFGEEQIKAVYQCLNKQYTLLVIDNLDAAQAKEKDDILLFLSNLPTKVQAIITTRDKGFSYSPLSLEPLSKKEGLQLIQQQGKEKADLLTYQESQEIYNTAGGIPLAIIYAIGQKKVSLKINYSFIKLILDNFLDNKTYPLFKKSQELLKNRIEQELLIAISFFPDAPVLEAISEVAGLELNSLDINQGLEKLKKLSLIRQQNNQYSMHPVTREYIAKEMLQYYDFEQDARVRWVKWHLKIAEKYGGKDWKNWHNKYDQLDREWNNLLAVLEWCAGQGYYESVRELWKSINQFANLYGYWNDRIFWLSWLMKESTKREDWNTASYCMSEKGFTLIQRGDLTNAESLLQEAFDLVKTFDLSSNKNSENQTLICEHLALLYINKNKYRLARYWLKQEKICAEKIKNIQQREFNRRMIAIDTLQAEILYKKESYQEAKKLYEQIVKESAQIGWHRRKHQAQERISIIESELASTRFRQTHRSFKNSKSNNIRQRELNTSSLSQNLYG